MRKFILWAVLLITLSVVFLFGQTRDTKITTTDNPLINTTTPTVSSLYSSINWTQLAGLCVVVGALHGVFMKYIVVPTITKAISDTIDPLRIKVASMETEMGIRVNDANREHDAIWKAIDRLREE